MKWGRFYIEHIRDRSYMCVLNKRQPVLHTIYLVRTQYIYNEAHCLHRIMATAWRSSVHSDPNGARRLSFVGNCQVIRTRTPSPASTGGTDYNVSKTLLLRLALTLGRVLVSAKLLKKAKALPTSEAWQVSASIDPS